MSYVYRSKMWILVSGRVSVFVPCFTFDNLLISVPSEKNYRQTPEEKFVVFKNSLQQPWLKLS